WWARYIDKIWRLAIEHQLKVVVDANVLDQSDSFVATFCDGIVNHTKVDGFAGAPSRQMGFRRNFTKAGDCASQFHPDQILHCGGNPINPRPRWHRWGPFWEWLCRPSSALRAGGNNGSPEPRLRSP